MVRLLRFVLLLLLAICMSWDIAAQKTLKGQVQDIKGEAIVAANLIIRAAAETPILAFSITDNNGAFSLLIPAEMDSVFVTITHLSYATQSFFIQTDIPYMTVELLPQEYELPELVVKNKPFVRRGDTISFDLSRYREVSDENIEQVLRRIPGINVEDNGRILYDGFDISKFYIEGLDMLEGRYRLVTRNLNIDAVRDIEVIEHHQPIQALDSLVRPVNAAINLRLKSTIALTGSLQGSTGLSPVLYLGKADIFGFTKKQQFHVLLGANNIGEAQQPNFENLYASLAKLEPAFITVNQALAPWQIDNSSYLDNRERIAGGNFLRKLSKNTEFKWQGFASSDQIRKVGDRLLRYQDEGSDIEFTEELYATVVPLAIKNRFIIESNTKSVFFRADINAELGQTDFQANNLVNGVAFPETLDEQLWKTSASLSTIIRQGDKAFKIDTDINYQVTDYDLRLMPVDIFTPIREASRYVEGKQLARRKNLETDSYSNLFFRKKRIKGQLRLGTRYQRTHLETDIFVRDNTDELRTLGTTFQNDNVVSKLVPYMNQAFKWQKNKNTWAFNLPLSVHLVEVNDRMSKQLISFVPFVFRPQLSYQTLLPKGKALSLSYTFSHAYDEFATLFHEGYVIRSSRNLANSIFDLNQYYRQELYIRFSGKNIIKRREYAVSINLSETQFDFINNNIFTNLGLVSDLKATKNVLQRLNGQGFLSLPLSGKTSFELRSQYTLSSRPSLLNGKRIGIQNHFFMANPNFYFTLDQSIISFKPNFQVFANNLSEQTSFQFNPALTYFLQLPSLGSIRLMYHQYWTNVKGEQIWNEFMNLEYKYYWKKQKLECALKINNLTGNTEYIHFTQNTFSETLNRYLLRPRQLIISVLKKF